MADEKQKQLDAVNAMIAELGIDVEAATSPQLVATAPRPGISTGPGSAVSSGPGRTGMSSGPGISRGPGAMSSGPGVMSSGPGMRSNGPGMMSAGPGAMRGGPNIVPATHAPNGQALTYNGPPCAGCGEMIIGAVVNAMDKQWHAEHFVCAQCGRPFPNGNFLEMEGRPYCEDDYNELFGPKCAYCTKPITDTCINAVGRTYHPDHFYCHNCGTELRGKPYKEHEGEPFCVSCKAAVTTLIEPSAGICGKCKKPIIGEYITLHGQRMHPEHFRCEECNCEFKGGNCHEYEGRLYCYPDYLKLLKSICGLCKKPIVGRSVTALGKVWHPEHFLCFTCKEPFGGSTFHEKEGNAYCEPHYLQLFGKVCFKCNKPIADDGITALGKHYHREHFVCSGCDKPLGKEIWDFESKPFCKKCYEALPKEVRKKLEKKKKGEAQAQKDREKQARKDMKAAAKGQ